MPRPAPMDLSSSLEILIRAELLQNLTMCSPTLQRRRLPPLDRLKTPLPLLWWTLLLLIHNYNQNRHLGDRHTQKQQQTATFHSVDRNPAIYLLLQEAQAVQVVKSSNHHLNLSFVQWIPPKRLLQPPRPFRRRPTKVVLGSVLLNPSSPHPINLDWHHPHL